MLWSCHIDGMRTNHDAGNALHCLDDAVAEVRHREDRARDHRNLQAGQAGGRGALQCSSVAAAAAAAVRTSVPLCTSLDHLFVAPSDLVTAALMTPNTSTDRLELMLMCSADGSACAGVRLGGFSSTGTWRRMSTQQQRQRRGAQREQLQLAPQQLQLHLSSWCHLSVDDWRATTPPHVRAVGSHCAAQQDCLSRHAVSR